jgi:ParB-like chromosome segregation protein Spo0J
MILCGHGRYAAAVEMGLEAVPCTVLQHLSEAQKRAYIIADNRIAENAGWNKELLALEITELDIAEFDLSLIGIPEKELAKLLPGEDAIMEDMPDLPEGGKSEYQQMTFTLHNTQAELVKAAMVAAKKIRPFDETLNKNSNGNAITRVCEMFLENHGNS